MEIDANPHGNSNCYSDAFSHADSDCNADADPKSHSNPYADAYSHPNGDTNTDRYSNPDPGLWTNFRHLHLRQ